MKKRIVFGILAFICLVGAVYFFTFWNTKGTASPLPVLGNPGHKVGNFTLVDQTGDTVTQKILTDKVSVVEYFYTTCPGICIPMNENMSRIYEELKDLPRFQILSNTVDPETDSVATLAAYAKQWNADPEVWKFLTGSKDQIFTTAVKGYLLNAADSVGVNDEYVHTQWFALVDQKRQIRGFYDGLKEKDIEKLKSDVRRLLEEGKEG